MGVTCAQEVLMGKDDYLRSFKENADDFICSLLPGASTHPEIQYSPGKSYMHRYLPTIKNYITAH